ncbi:hypothetical protein RND71_023699 [Anisodus tanguticus]|uniref:Cyclin-D1-binding protein 1-like N-terminal domain-containing protein n=1 Tax=Anisodus tanguticus TaxID=243964 RepID=A0AAE1VE25_9SOLA|nr:hypothetical protein RND71_023699 [Anisodus tanguticus]
MAQNRLKETPATNITAIGRAMTQLAVSMKDVLREMNELKPAYESSVQDSAEGESKSHDSDDSFAGDVGNDLSPEEMKIARLITDVVSCNTCGGIGCEVSGKCRLTALVSPTRKVVNRFKRNAFSLLPIWLNIEQSIHVHGPQASSFSKERKRGRGGEM